MLKRSMLVLVVSTAMIFGVMTSIADNSLDVNANAAIEGNFGLEVLVDGSANQAFVASTDATDETVYRFQFRANPNDIDMANGDVHAIFMGRMAGGEGNIIRILMRYEGSNDTYKLRCRWKRNGGGTGFCGQFTFAPNNTLITGEWTASDAGQTNGIFRLFKGVNLENERTDLDNSDFDIDTARLGLPQGADPATNGSFYLDDFASFRTLAP